MFFLFFFYFIIFFEKFEWLGDKICYFFINSVCIYVKSNVYYLVMLLKGGIFMIDEKIYE